MRHFFLVRTKRKPAYQRKTSPPGPPNWQLLGPRGRICHDSVALLRFELITPAGSNRFFFGTRLSDHLAAGGCVSAPSDGNIRFYKGFYDFEVSNWDPFLARTKRKPHDVPKRTSSVAPPKGCFLVREGRNSRIYKPSENLN